MYETRLVYAIYQLDDELEVMEMNDWEDCEYDQTKFLTKDRFDSRGEAIEALERMKVNAMRTLGLLPMSHTLQQQVFSMRVLGYFKR